MRPLGIIAGGGDMPLILAQGVEGFTPVILAFEGQPIDPDLFQYPNEVIPIGAIGRSVQFLKKQGVRDVVMVGAFRRPDLKTVKPDWEGTKLLARLSIAGALGDDGLLRIMIEYLESQGFRVHGVDQLIKSLLATPGYWGNHRPTEDHLKDIHYGRKVAKTLGELDVGQGVVVQDGVIIGVEGVEGTDGLLLRLEPFIKGRGGVLVKTCKPQQERRADLPTIGPLTLENAGKIGLSGVVVEAGHTLVLHKNKLVSLADDAGLFVGAIDRE